MAGITRNAGLLQGVKISTAAPSDGQLLKYVNANGDWEPATVSSGGTPFIDEQDPQGSSTTGTSSDQTMYSTTLGAGVPGAGKAIAIQFAFTTGGTGTMNLYVKIGANKTGIMWQLAAGSGPYAYTVTISNLSGVQNSQFVLISGSSNTGAINNAATTLATDMSGGVAVSIIVNVANTATWKGLGWHVGLI